MRLNTTLPAKIAFMHVPKTAGTSVTDHLVRLLCRERGYKQHFLPRTEANQIANTPWIRNLTSEEMIGIAHDASPYQFFRDHTPWSLEAFHELKNNDWFVFSFVRHPGDLACSWYHYMQTNGQWLDKSLEECLVLLFNRPLDWLIPDYWRQIDFIREFSEANVRELFEDRLGLALKGFPHVNRSANRGFEFYCRAGEISPETRRLVESHEQFKRFSAIRDIAPARRGQKRKKILFVNHEESLTGAPLVLLRIAETLQEMNSRFEVKVISKRQGSAHDLFASRLCVAPSEKEQSKGLMYKRALRALMQWRPDLVYANSAESYEYCLAARSLGIPSIYHLHELHGGIDSVRRSHRLENMPEGDGLFRECADLFICPCPETADILFFEHGIDPFKTHVVPEFIDPDRVREQAKLDPPAQRFSGPVVVGCGTAIRRKGIDLFVQTAARMPEASFVWIGKTVEQTMPQQWPTNVHFLGEFSNPFPQMAAADVLLLSSREDPFPLVALEAMALGLPVAAWRWSGGIHAALKDCGVLAEDPTPVSFEKAIRLCLEPALKERAARTGPDRVRKLYSEKVNLPRVVRLIERTLASHVPAETGVLVS